MLLSAVVFPAAGCIQRSPILLNEHERKTNPNRLPFAVGLKIQLAEHLTQGPLSHVFTIPLVLPPTMVFKAGFPRISEGEYLLFSIRDYLRDNDMFEYVYPEPFDPNDIDLIFQLKVRACQNDNSVYGTVIPLTYYVPVLGYFIFFCAPMEHFRAQLDCELEVQLPNGQTIATYESAGTATDWVRIYEQPYATYMWYRSIFRKRFLGMMDTFKTAIERDASVLVRACEQYRRRPR